MSVSGQLSSDGQLVRFDGLDSRVPKSKWRTWLNDVADSWMERIAEDYADEMAAGRQLGQNTEKYEDYKASQGLDSRRGHLTGETQDALDAGGLYRVSAVQGNGAATIQMQDGKLFAQAPQAAHYQEMLRKVYGKKILRVLKSDVAEAEDYLNARMVEVLGKDALRKVRRENQRTGARLRYEETRTTGARAVRVRVV